MDCVQNQLAGLTPNDVTLVFSRSDGPGGQNVNKVSTRVTLRFDLEGSAHFSPAQKERIRRKLARRIGKDGVLQVSSTRFRSQDKNRTDAWERFLALLTLALHADPPRRRSGPPPASRAQRLDEKRRRAQVKRGRTAPPDEE